MIMRIQGCKANGSPNNTYWYITGVYLDEDEVPQWTMSTDIFKARDYTFAEADMVNKKFIDLGRFTKPLEIVKR